MQNDIWNQLAKIDIWRFGLIFLVSEIVLFVAEVSQENSVVCWKI